MYWTVVVVVFSTQVTDQPPAHSASVVDPAWNEVLPTTYVLARDGRVVRRVQGAKTHDEFRVLIEAALEPAATR